MKKYFDTVANANGSPVSGALVTVLNFGTATPSTIFSDAAGTASLANPVTTNSRGFFEFYAADGRYSLSITGAGFPAVSVTDILLDDPADANTVVINGGSVNGTPIGATTPSTGAFTTVTASGNVVVTGTVTGTSFTGAGTGLTGTASALSIGGNAASLTTARTIGGSSFDGMANVTSFPAPGPIGGTTPSTGAFTTLSATGNVTLGDATTDTLNVGNGGLIKDAAGNLGVGVIPSARNNTSLQIVNGIGFPATQVPSTDPNTLDDYEEGTWSPTQGGGLTVVGTFGSIGSYVKIGRQVTVTGQLTGSTSISASAGGIVCAGLPFAASGFGAGGLSNAAITQTSVALASSSNIYSSAAITANENISFACTYFV